MASANPFALIGNNNLSMDDDDDDPQLDSALEEKRREAEQKLLGDDDDVHIDSTKTDLRHQKQRNEGWVNEYRDKDVPGPDPSKPFVFSREWLLKLHRPDYSMPADFVFTPTITTQEPLPPVAFLPADEFEGGMTVVRGHRDRNRGGRFQKNRDEHQGGFNRRNEGDSQFGNRRAPGANRGRNWKDETDAPEGDAAGLDQRRRGPRDVPAEPTDAASTAEQVNWREQRRLQLIAEKQAGGSVDAGRKSPNPIAPPSAAIDPAVVAASIGGSPAFVASSSFPAVSKTDKWWYKDPQGEVQGPFSAEDMTTWLLAGYFGADLLVRRGDSTGDFTMLGKIFLDEQRHPFSGQSLIEFFSSKPTIHPFKTQLMQLQQQQMLLLQQKAAAASAGSTPNALAQLLAAASLASPAVPSPAPALLLLQQQLAHLKLAQPVSAPEDAANPLVQILAAANLVQQQQQQLPTQTAAAPQPQAAPQQQQPAAPAKPSVAPWAGWGKQTSAAPAVAPGAAAPAANAPAATATAAALSQQQQVLQQQVQKQQTALQQMSAPAKAAEPAAELTRKQGVFRIEDLERGSKASEPETRKSQELHKDGAKKTGGVPWSASTSASTKSLREIQEQEALSRAPGSAPTQQPAAVQPTTKEVSAAALVEAAADPSLKSLWGALFQKPIEEDVETTPEPEPAPAPAPVKVAEPVPKSKKAAKSTEAPWNPQPAGKSLAEIQAEELKRKQEEDAQREREQAEARKQQQAQKKAGWTQQQQAAKKAAPQPAADPSKPRKKTLLEIQQEELEAERRRKQQEEEEAAAMANSVGASKKPLFGAWAAPAATQRNIVPLSQIQQQEAAAAAKSGNYSMAATIAKATKTSGSGGGGVWNTSPAASPAAKAPAPVVDEDEDDSFWDYPTSKPTAPAAGAKKAAPAPSKAPAAGASKKRGKKPKKLLDPSALGFAAPSRPVADDDDE